MTPSERYKAATGPLPTSATDRFVLRLWDGMDGAWIDVVTDLTLAEALDLWCTHTRDGAKNTDYDDIDYYRIFPANTKMLYGDDFTLRDAHDA